MTQKKKVGRPKKTSTPVKQKRRYINWKQKYEQAAQQLQLHKESHDVFAASANEILQGLTNTQHELLEVVLDGYHSIQEQCKIAVNLTGKIEMQDIEYPVNFAKRVLLNKFSQLVETQED
jgi:hypothetical protein